LDRRRHHRYAASARAEVQILRDVDIESISAAALAVLTDTPTAAGVDASVRVTSGNQAQVTLRVRAMSCQHVVVGGRRRYRVIYAVLSAEDCAAA
jgi:hypothetical protein